MRTSIAQLARVAFGTLFVLASLSHAEITPIFTEDFDAFDANTDFGDGELHGVELIPENESPFGDGEAMRMFDFNTEDKPELQGEFFEPLIDPFRIDFQSFNNLISDSSSAIRFRMANAGKNISSESRVAFSLSWQADGKLTAKSEREDGGVATKSIFLDPDNVSNVTMVANPADAGTYSYSLFGESRTLEPLSYDVYVDEFLLNADDDTGLPFTLTKSADEYDPAQGLQRFGLIGSSNANVDPDILFDNIILRTGADIAPDDNTPILGDTNLDGAIDVADIDLLSAAVRDGASDVKFDINQDGNVDDADRQAWIADVKKTWVGDSNLDGFFDSGDIVEAFQNGEYEDAIAGNSTWMTGDWSGDGDFTSGDFVAAFSDGGFEAGARAAVSAVPEPSSGLLLMLAALLLPRARASRE